MIPTNLLIRIKFARACAVASLLLAGFACHAARPGGTTPAATGFVARTTTVDGMLYRYQVFVPRGTDRGARPPVILSLHGAGERGTDGQLQTMVGLGPVVRGRAESFPAVVVMPQAPSDSVWSGAPARAAARSARGRRGLPDPELLRPGGAPVGLAGPRRRPAAPPAKSDPDPM